MKIAFISDIHGNATALEAVLNDIKSEDVDKIYVLGDICFRGPEPKRALQLVRSLGTEVIKGNTDEWLVRGIADGEAREDELEMLEQERQWTLQRLDEDDLDYLKSLPTEAVVEDGLDLIIHAFHATPSSLFETVQADETNEIEDKIMLLDDADIYVYGHTHRPFVRTLHGKSVVNTGGVGMSFDGQALASYAIVEIGEGRHRIQINRVPYHREHVVELFKQGRYPNTEAMSRVIFYGVTP